MASNEFIRRANQEVEFNASMAIELKKCAEDPVYFISNYCYVQHPKLGKVKFKLRPYQVKIVEALKNNRWNVLLIGRQAGKTETCGAFAYWYACFHDDKKVLVASNKQKGATDIMNRIKFMYENTPDFLRPGVLYYNRGSIEFDNGSIINSEATTETTGRGRAVSLVILDELAFVPKRIQEEMWASLLPTLSTGGQIVIMSTPNGDDDLYAEIWRGAVSETNGFNAIHVDVDEIPITLDDGTETFRSNPVWQAQLRSKIGDLKFEQEYLAVFLSSDQLLIKSLVLNRLKGVTPLDKNKGFSIWSKFDPNKTYLIGSDVAEGTENDFSTIEVIELETLEQVAEFRSNVIKETQLYNAIKFIIELILSNVDPRTGKKPTVYWSFENNSAGASICTLYYNDEKFPADAILINGKGERVGFRTVNKPKLEACRSLKNLTEKQNGLVLKSTLLINELKNYVSKGASYAAKRGSTDDLVSAMLIVMRIIKQLSEYEPEVFDKLYNTDADFYEEKTNDYDEPIPFVC